jgi:hypothetical protein
MSAILAHGNWHHFVCNVLLPLRLAAEILQGKNDILDLMDFGLRHPKLSTLAGSTMANPSRSLHKL